MYPPKLGIRIFIRSLFVRVRELMGAIGSSDVRSGFFAAAAVALLGVICLSVGKILPSLKFFFIGLGSTYFSFTVAI